MGTKTIVKDESTQTYRYVNTLGKKEQVNTELLSYIEAQRIQSVMPITGVETLNNKRGRILTIDLKDTYSIRTRLTKEKISSSEFLILLKDLNDAINELVASGITINYAELNIDRVFINPDGRLKLTIWGTQDPQNTGSVLDMFIEMSNLARPRTKSDSTLIEEYKQLFATPSDPAVYMDSINTFIEKQYSELEKYLINMYRKKGHQIEGEPDAKDLQKLNSLEQENEELKEKVIELNRKLVSKIDTQTQQPQYQPEPRPQAQPEITSDAISKLIEQKLAEALGNVTQSQTQPQTQVQQQVRPQTQPQPQVQEPQLEEISYAPDLDNDTDEYIPAPADAPEPLEEQSATTVLDNDVYNDTDILAIKRKQELEEQEFLNSDATSVLVDDNTTIKPQLIRNSNKDIVEIKSGTSVVGKNRVKSDIFIDDNPAVSNRHAIIEYEAGAESLDITDESSNGTFVNGYKIPAGMPSTLYDGDIISFANEQYELKFK